MTNRQLQKYNEYIESHHGTYEKTYGKCREACEAMAKEFPELRIAKGHADTLGWGRRAHWWLVADNGSIIDPTRKQFPGVYNYDEWEPGKEVCVGKCCNCGGEIWEAVQDLEHIENKMLCGPSCERAYQIYVTGAYDKGRAYRGS